MHLKEKFINITYLVTIHYVILLSLILPSIKTTSCIHSEGFVEITLYQKQPELKGNTQHLLM